MERAPDAYASYYFFLRESSLVRERQLGKRGVPIDDLRFYLQPLTTGGTNPGLPLSPTIDRTFVQSSDGKQLSDQLEEEARLSQVREQLKLWRQVSLTPAIGEWIVFILTSTDVSSGERDVLVNQWQDEGVALTLRIPYLQVSPTR